MEKSKRNSKLQVYLRTTHRSRSQPTATTPVKSSVLHPCWPYSCSSASSWPPSVSSSALPQLFFRKIMQPLTSFPLVFTHYLNCPLQQTPRVEQTPGNLFHFLPTLVVFPLPVLPRTCYPKLLPHSIWEDSRRGHRHQKEVLLSLLLSWSRP